MANTVKTVSKEVVEAFTLFTDQQLIVLSCTLMVVMFIIHRGVLELGMLLMAAGIVAATWVMKVYLPFNVILTLSVMIGVIAIIREKTLPNVITYLLLGTLAGVQVLYFNAYLSQKTIMTFSLVIIVLGLGVIFFRR